MSKIISSVPYLSGQIKSTGSSSIFEGLSGLRTSNDSISVKSSNIVFEKNDKIFSDQNLTINGDEIITREERSSFYKKILKANYNI